MKEVINFWDFKQLMKKLKEYWKEEIDGVVKSYNLIDLKKDWNGMKFNVEIFDQM